MNRMKSALCAAMLVMAWAMPAKASPIAIVNPSFEEPDTVFYNAGSLTGWTLSDPLNQGPFQPDVSPGVYYTGIGATDGFQVAFLNGGNISQVLADVLTVGMSYIFQVDVGDRKDIVFPGYKFRLYAGASLIAEESSLTPDDEYLTSFLSYDVLPGDPNAGGQLKLELVADGTQANFDNVRGDVGVLEGEVNPAPIPEPASLILMGTGLLISAKRFRKKATA